MSQLAEDLRLATKIVQAQPLCPDCKGMLLYRPSDRRYVENHTIVQCEEGHVWELTRRLEAE